MRNPLEGYGIVDVEDHFDGRDDGDNGDDGDGVLGDDDYAAFCGEFAGEFPDLCDDDCRCEDNGCEG